MNATLGLDGLFRFGADDATVAPIHQEWMDHKIACAARQMGIDLTVNPDDVASEGVSVLAHAVFVAMVGNPDNMRAFRAIYGYDFAGMSIDAYEEHARHTAPSDARTVR